MTSPIANAFAASPRRQLGFIRYLVVAVLLLSVIWLYRSSSLPATFKGLKPNTPPTSILQDNYGAHPIDLLIQAGEEEFDNLLSKQKYDVNAAAAEYRKRRGRHPPPGFEAWFEFAKEKGAVMVEDFWDQIYHDLGPFWGLPADQIRRDAKDFEMTINVRNGKATAGSDWFWTKIWLNLIQTIEQHVPDMDIALNAMDEPRLVVPWEDINRYMEAERASRSMPPPEEVISQYGGLAGVDQDRMPTSNKEWEDTQPYYSIARRGCPPDSLARKAELMTDFDHKPSVSMQHAVAHSYKGYVSNYTLSTLICHQPDLQGLHGALINPLTVSATKKLFPMFGGSKFAINNEILLPAPMYWSNEERFSGGENHGAPWSEKADKMIWRGVATGGKNKPTNWKGFQRHRFIAMINGTKVRGAETWEELPVNWDMPSQSYDLKAMRRGHLGDWLDGFSDAAFVDLMCEKPEEGATCYYTKDQFKMAPGMPMAEQFANKYLPDIDGNSFSGRYRGFLLSTSLPIKSTLFREWHDSRLVPWKHFVPMDNRYLDVYGILEYFLGYQGFEDQDAENRVQGRDEAARKIAMAGQDWANKVLRREDMQVYVLRLLLEYARVSDDKREKLGYVADLLR
ncbi:hypothetical protein MMC16_005072 [Acarospora aff. strigata]|nr:hypothetical protein [Acarospora aff. strigata]